MTRLIRWLSLACVVIGIGGLTRFALREVGDSTANSRPSRAALILPPMTQDLGQSTQRKTWEVVFPIHNAGTRRLVLNERDRECNCGNRTRRTILIPPGETVEIAVALDTRYATGQVEAIAEFTTNAPDHPRFQLTARVWIDENTATRKTLAHHRPLKSVTRDK